MPLEMTATWLAAGVALIVAMLCLATVLPRPSAEYSLSRVPFALAWTVRKASQFAIVPDGIKDDASENVATTSAKEGQETNREGESGGKQESKGQKSGSKSKKGGKGGQSEQGSSGDESSKGQGDSSDDSKGSKGGGQKGKSGSGDKSKSDKSGGADSQKGEGSKQRDGDSSDPSRQERQGQSSEQNSSPPNSQPEPPASQPESRQPLSQSVSQVVSGLTQTLGTLIRWAFYAVLLIGAVIAVLYYREEFGRRGRSCSLNCASCLPRGSAQKSPLSQCGPGDPRSPPPRRFSSYDNPFETGAAATDVVARASPLHV